MCMLHGLLVGCFGKCNVFMLFYKAVVGVVCCLLLGLAAAWVDMFDKVIGGVLVL